MARISGIDLPRDKRIEIALTYIYGIGRKTASNICTETGVNPGNTSHSYTSMFSPQGSALALLMLGVVTDDHDLALTFDDLALLTHLLNRRPYFHL